MSKRARREHEFDVVSEGGRNIQFVVTPKSDRILKRVRYVVDATDGDDTFDEIDGDLAAIKPLAVQGDQRSEMTAGRMSAEEYAVHIAATILFLSNVSIDPSDSIRNVLNCARKRYSNAVADADRDEIEACKGGAHRRRAIEMSALIA